MSSNQIFPYKNIIPQIDPSAFIAAGARIAGDVMIGAHSSVWFNVAMRGDVGAIRIGARSNIQDGAVLHMTGGQSDTIIGDDVTVGHMALLHSCGIADECLVGMGSIMLDNTRMEKHSMLAAGSLLTPGKIVPSGQLWGGSPARYMRDLTDQEILFFKKSSDNYVRAAQGYME